MARLATWIVRHVGRVQVQRSEDSPTCLPTASTVPTHMHVSPPPMFLSLSLLPLSLSFSSLSFSPLSLSCSSLPSIQPLARLSLPFNPSLSWPRLLSVLPSPLSSCVGDRRPVAVTVTSAISVLLPRKPGGGTSSTSTGTLRVPVTVRTRLRTRVDQGPIARQSEVSGDVGGAQPRHYPSTLVHMKV